MLATGIGLVPRLAASVAKLTFNPALLMTDAEAYLVAEPVPVGPRNGYQPVVEGWMPFSRMFDLLWGGRRHAMVGPVQIDRYGQSNISIVGDYAKPKAAMLGVRGFPGNSINHANSMFVPNHTTRSFVAGEVDMVGGVGYNPKRWPDGRKPRGFDIRLIVTELARAGFHGAGLSDERSFAASGCDVRRGAGQHRLSPCTGRTRSQSRRAPSAQALQLIRERLDPHNLRADVFKEQSAGRA